MATNSKASLDDEVQGLLAGQNKASDTVALFNQTVKKEKVQMGFIRKVYGILTFQLTTTFAFAIVASNVPSLKEFMLLNAWLMVFAIVLSVVALYSLVCFVQFQRTVPYNYLMLLLFTLCEAYVVAYFCLGFTPSEVYQAAFMCVTLSAGLTVYACLTKSDFTLWGGFLFLATLVLIVGGVILVFFQTPFLLVIYDCLGLLLFGFYLIYDTQLIIGTKSAAYSVDDYILATMNVYLDVINIFLDMLSLIGKK